MHFALLQELIEKGGSVIILLLLCSVYVGAVIIYKIWQFWHAGMFHKKNWLPLQHAIQDGNFKQASRDAEKNQGPLSHIIRTTFSLLEQEKSPGQRREEIEVAGSALLRTYESHLRGLDLMAQISPLLGLLGTVIGIIRTFSSIEHMGTQVNPSMLAGGIWEALLTTVAGLCVAIPALSAHYLIDGKIESIRTQMKESVSLILTRHAS